MKETRIYWLFCKLILDENCVRLLVLFEIHCSYFQNTWVKKPYLFAAHIPEIGYITKCPVPPSPQKKKYPTLAA